MRYGTNLHTQFYLYMEHSVNSFQNYSVMHKLTAQLSVKTIIVGIKNSLDGVGGSEGVKPCIAGDCNQRCPPRPPRRRWWSGASPPTAPREPSAQQESSPPAPA